MSTGLIDRFRSLPMSRAAVLAGRTLADLLTQASGALVVAGVGLAIGWRVHTGIAEHHLAAFGLACCSATPSPGPAPAWAWCCAARSGPAARVHPVPAAHVRLQRIRPDPGHARLAAGRRRSANPLSAPGRRVPAICFGNPDPAATVQVWPMQHPVLSVFLWSGALLAVFAPLAVHLYRRKSLT